MTNWDNNFRGWHQFRCWWGRDAGDARCVCVHSASINVLLVGKTSTNVLRKEKSLRISTGTEAISACATEITAKEEGKFSSYSRLD